MRRHVLAAAVSGWLLMAGVAAAPQVVDRFTAFAVNLSDMSRAPTAIVEIAVNRWSTDAERDRLFSAALEKGNDKLLDVLTDLPKAGTIRTPDSLGYNLQYARHFTRPDGIERVILMTDRPMSFWEIWRRPATADYPFMVIELRLNREGEGEGKLSLASRLTTDRDHKTIVLEDYAAQPVMLENVKRVAVH